MNKKAAFFDLDGTLLRKPSSENRFLYYLAKNRYMGPMQIAAGLLFYVRWYAHFENDTGRKNKAFYYGLQASQLQAQAKQWVAENLKNLLYEQVAGHIETSRKRGYTLVLMTGTPDFLAEPIAEYLNMDTFIATELSTEAGRFTAAPPKQHPLAKEKLLLAKNWCETHNIELAECTAYGDSYQDYDLLSAVNHPYAINPDRRMEKLATAENWPIITTT